MQIIDNFFTDPYKIRKEALDIKKWNCNYRYPGYRQDVSESLASKYLYQIRSILNEDVKVDDPRENIRFQFMDKSWGRGLVHFDKAKYTVLTFLTPSAPSNSGIEIYDERRGHHNLNWRGHKIDDFTREVKKGYYTSDRNPIRRFFFERKARQLNSIFKNPCIISNVFNRTVIFEGQRVHRAQDYFGTKLHDSRLIMIGFLT